jgi:preprotein translocase subunit SecA
VGLRAYGQRDPVVEYRIESFEMFDEMINAIQEETIGMIFRISVKSNLEHKQVGNTTAGKATNRAQRRRTSGAAPQVSNTPQNPNEPVHVDQKIGRNEPCPCGSGKKYKNCHGKT